MKCGTDQHRDHRVRDDPEGSVGVGGSIGAVVYRSLMSIRAFIDRPSAKAEAPLTPDGETVRVKQK
jgi:hypothetical protein